MGVEAPKTSISRCASALLGGRDCHGPRRQTDQPCQAADKGALVLSCTTGQPVGTAAPASPSPVPALLGKAEGSRGGDVPACPHPPPGGPCCPPATQDVSLLLPLPMWCSSKKTTEICPPPAFPRQAAVADSQKEIAPGGGGGAGGISWPLAGLLSCGHSPSSHSSTRPVSASRGPRGTDKASFGQCDQLRTSCRGASSWEADH